MIHYKVNIKPLKWEMKEEENYLFFSGVVLDGYGVAVTKAEEFAYYKWDVVKKTPQSVKNFNLSDFLHENIVDIYERQKLYEAKYVKEFIRKIKDINKLIQETLVLSLDIQTEVSEELNDWVKEFLKITGEPFPAPPEGKLCSNCRFPFAGEGCRGYIIENPDLCWQPKEEENAN